MFRPFTPLLVPLVAILMLCACSTEEPGPEAAEIALPPEPLRFLEPPSGPGAMAPNLVASRDGVLLTWLEPSDGRFGLYQAELRGEQWTSPRLIAAGDNFFANWADLTAATEDVDGTRFAHSLRKLGADTYAYGVDLAHSSDGGETWEALGLLHDDATPAEHGFVSYVPLADGGVQAFWLDGRKMPSGGTMELRTTRIGEAAPEASTLLDDRVCECCATDAALAAAGPVVVYRDRDLSEIRDIAVVRWSAEGWTEPALIHADGWQIHGCPVNGPAIAADGDRVAVAWFTAGAQRPRVAVAFSDDGGASFGAPISVDDAEPLGRVDVALDAEGRALVSWMGSTSEGAEIRWRRIAANRESDPPQVVVATTAKRSAGVPRMLRLGEDLLFAWVEDAEPSRLRSALVPLG